jgi:hypothetical protein
MGAPSHADNSSGHNNIQPWMDLPDGSLPRRLDSPGENERALQLIAVKTMMALVAPPDRFLR